ncbi:MAG: hypothetical protein ACXVDN_13265 [Ktedonobacteraceae bacterium]
MTQRYSLESKDIPEEIRSSLRQIHRLILPTQGDTSAVAVADTANGRFVIKRSYGEQFSCGLSKSTRF